MAGGGPQVKPRRPLVIASRGSRLARLQADLVRDALRRAVPELAAPDRIVLRTLRTSGDRFLAQPLTELGGKGLFTKELDEAVARGEVDFAVHSMKDVPVPLAAGLVIGAYLPRGPLEEVLVAPHATGLDALPPQSRLGTSSPRRKALVLARRPDLRVVPLRGNVETRLAKVQRGEVDATLLARAGLMRLGLAPDGASVLAPEVLLPAAGQGAIGVACRADDRWALGILARIDHLSTRVGVEAERAFLARLEGSCRTPIAALCEVDGEQVRFRGLLAAPDGSVVRRVERRGAAREACALARDAADAVLAALPDRAQWTAEPPGRDG